MGEVLRKMFISGQLIVRERTNFGGLLVSACLESLRGFLGEIIVVDNGCTEKVQSDIMSALNQSDCEYSFIEDSGNDFSTLRNLALSKMNPKSDWLFQFDSDDIFWPDRLALVKDKMIDCRNCCLYGHFYHLMQTPYLYQGMYKHRHLYPISGKAIRWEMPVHEKLAGDIPEKEEDSGLTWTHWGYTRSVIATAIKWVHYQLLETGSADCYKKDCLFSSQGIEHILDDRFLLCMQYKQKYPPAAQKWILNKFSASRSKTWQEWVTQELDPQLGDFLNIFKKAILGEKLGYAGSSYWPSVVDYIVKEKLWERI